MEFSIIILIGPLPGQENEIRNRKEINYNLCYKLPYAYNLHSHSDSQIYLPVPTHPIDTSDADTSMVGEAETCT